LNQAFQATLVSSSEIKPLSPVLLSISESSISNMMIVQPPAEIVQQLVDDNKTSSALDFNGLDLDVLSSKVFFDPYEKYASILNADLLMIDYLANAFDGGSAIAPLFGVGYNSTNQVMTTDKQTSWQLQRSVNQKATLVINKAEGYNITLIQDGTTVNVNNLDTSSNRIIIKQGE
jgi:hypothetical protein